jgi:hypothetical protein
VPLIVRIRGIRKGAQAGNQDKGSRKHSSPPVEPPINSSPAKGKDDERPGEPIPIAFILPKNFKKVGNAHNKKLKLRLPSDPVEQKDTGNVEATCYNIFISFFFHLCLYLLYLYAGVGVATATDHPRVEKAAENIGEGCSKYCPTKNRQCSKVGCSRFHPSRLQAYR